MKKIFTLLSVVAISTAFGQLSNTGVYKSNHLISNSTQTTSNLVQEHQLVQYLDPNSRQNMVACSDATGVLNHFSRVFDFAEYGITTDFTVTSVGVFGSAQSAGGDILDLAFSSFEGDYTAANITAGLNDDAYGSFLFTSSGFEDVELFDTAVFPANKKLAVAVTTTLASDGTTFTGGVFIGNNEAGETSPSYLGWPGTECVSEDPVTIASLGYPQVMLFHLNGTTEELGIVELGGNKLSVAPNPATSEVTVALTDSKIAKVEAADVTGRVIPLKASLNGKVNISNLSAGVYFLRVQDDKGVTRIQKIIKK